MPQKSILSVQSSAGGVARLSNLLVGARSSVYRREIVETLLRRLGRLPRGIMMLAASRSVPSGCTAGYYGAFRERVGKERK
jgi:hypothetical protein